MTTFKGTPNLLIREWKTRKIIGRFDESGLLTLTNKKHIEKMKIKFEEVEEKNKRRGKK